MSKIVGDEPCPKCRTQGRDSTGNHLIIFEDGGKACNRCGYKVRKEKKTPVRKDSLSEIATYALYEGDPIRGIKNSVRALYGDRVAVNMDTGAPTKVYYPKGKGWKVRTLNKKDFYSIGKTKGVLELYGWNVVKSANTIILCGGEEDAKAAHQMMSAAMPHNTPRCVSLPNGEGAFAAVSANLDKIHKHNRIVLCMDMDEAGRKATDKLAALIDRECLIAKMHLKDANDCLLDSPTRFVKCVVEAKPHSPSGIVRISDIIEDALRPPEWGVPFPWKSLTAVTYGMREGEGYYIGAGVKIGKSEFLNELVKHLVSLCKHTFIVKGEELVKKTARKLGGKLLDKVANRPDVDIAEEDMRGALEELDRYLLMYDRSNSLDWEDVKAAIRHAVIVCKCKFIFIDPVTCFTDGMESSDANRFLQQFAREIDQMAKDLGFTYFVFCHLNNPKTGPEHNMGGRVLTSQFTGSRAMTRATTYTIGIRRNKNPDLSEEERNTSYFEVLDDRENGNSCSFPVFYDTETGSYLEPDENEVPF